MKKLLLVLCALLAVVSGVKAATYSITYDTSNGTFYRNGEVCTDNWSSKWVSNESGKPVVTISTSVNNINAANGRMAPQTYTISVEGGYIVTGFSMDCPTFSADITVTPDGEPAVTVATGEKIVVNSSASSFVFSATNNQGRIQAASSDGGSFIITVEDDPNYVPMVYITDLSQLSNDKAYVVTNKRGRWTYNESAITQTSTATDINRNDVNQQTVIYKTSDGNYYIYSVAQGKFVTSSKSLSLDPQAITIGSTGDNDYPFYFKFDDSHYLNGGNGFMIIDTWSTLDDGNKNAIVEASDFNSNIIYELLNPSYTVTYIVKNANGEVLYTSDAKPTTSGTTITTLPDEYQLTNFYTYNTVNVTISATGNTNVEFIATPKENPLVNYTADDSNPYYYNLNIRSKYLVYDANATGEVTLQTTSEPFNADASWAFIGEPYAGFKVINKTKGTGYYLTYTSVVTGNNGGGDGSNNNVQFVAADDFNNRYWLIDKNNNGFVLRMKENTSIYFHHQNISGSNGYLRTCSVSEWSAVHNDAGSTIVAATDEAVLVALYDDLKDVTFGDAIGQYSVSGVSAADANATISGVGAALTNNMTSAYADAYAALQAIQAAMTLNKPAAGFYYVKNVATGKYLTATAVTGFSSDTDAVFANGEKNSPATVVELREDEGQFYMVNQGAFFNWVIADKSVGSGKAWVASNKDKYVNWFPGNNAGQIAFAICYGNGTGSYTSYLTKGIYTTDDNEAVVGGTDYTADAAQWVFESATTVSVPLSTIGEASYATTYLPFGVTAVEGADANILKLGKNNAYVKTEKIDEVPAGTGIVLIGSANATATLTIGEVSATVAENALTGHYFAGAVSDAYVLANPTEGLGFYALDGEQNVAANKAYIVLSSGSEVKAILFADSETGIKAVESTTADETIYNIAGQRVNKAVRGLYIMNGKKVVVK